MCDCECCRTRCSSTYERPRWGLPGWCGCTCGNCIAVYASEAYDAGRESLRGEVERLTAALADRDQRIEAALALLQWGRCADRECTTTSCVNSWAVTDALRGDSDA